MPAFLGGIALLLKAGANKDILDADTFKYLREVATNDPELKTLIA